MTKHDSQTFDAAQVHALASLGGPVIARVEYRDVSDEIVVSVAGAAPCVARLVASVDRAALMKPHNRGREVLVVFQDGDRGKPIIIGVMEERLESLVQFDVAKDEQAATTQEARVDGKRVVIEAEEEIELKCGQGSITIRKDGKIVVKGTHLLSRSSGPNRIKGGSISLN